MRQLWILVITLFATCSTLADTSLKPFDFPNQNDPRGTTAEPPTCEFTNLSLPKEFLVYATGAYSGREIDFQIDQSGHQATQFDLAINSPDKPVVLILGAYEPTIWNIGWSDNTKILGILVTGYHRQVVAGVDKKTPILISTYENKGACNSNYYINANRLDGINKISRQLFDKPVDMFYPVKKDGRVIIGKPLLQETKLVTSSEVPPESYYDKSMPKAGRAGIEEAIEKGILRRATQADEEAWAAELEKVSPKRDIPPIAGIGIQPRPKPNFRNEGYVVLKAFTIPAGLYGANSATFIIPKGVPKPKGNPGHSKIYDFNTIQCTGPGCDRY